MRRLADGECLTLSVLAREYGISDKRISKAASSLHARGYLMRAVAGCYRLTDDGLAAVARGEVITSGPIDADATVLERAPTNGFRDKLWRTMRAQREFTVVDIVMDAADGEKDCVNDAYRYLRILKSAGYVIEMPGRVPGNKPGSNGAKVFRLVRDTGSRAPLHRSKLGIVHDFNIGEDVPCNKS
ncbi:hypothetical protein [Paenirhodobacter populi]|uniref:hypothetical protein n=1 Tax=Paenirhodobacter populi TaxID=2306993 RepID=UPI001F502217|nr:hypothetical protein [Sinirhodobacter populi]